MNKNQEIIDKLNGLLSDFQIFYQNLRGFHWNIQGRNFFELHVKFEELYTDAAIKIDMIAERVLTVSGTPIHGFQDYLNTTELEPVKNVHDGEVAVKTIVSNLEKIIVKERAIKDLAGSLDDSGTEDLMSAFVEEQEKTLWMYKAWLK
ncbi:DNA starvation/stationary phase protection protein [Reichenbachiella agarivorans]|uniref:DNA starvation/stationary phase protection protein n=1 Tax=Reichenbachiella agarivorans TaxID=2979464 RepID=A0ABY6CU62_9BACT|nr:DNA starvation/stationary phase protection protein [Reichenbachiella agarivorans]UXP34055.1 DNA starvation/stationary phase protection protein [Reichenbachiella agarivorans]